MNESVFTLFNKNKPNMIRLLFLSAVIVFLSGCKKETTEQLITAYVENPTEESYQSLVEKINEERARPMTFLNALFNQPNKVSDTKTYWLLIEDDPLIYEMFLPILLKNNKKEFFDYLIKNYISNFHGDFLSDYKIMKIGELLINDEHLQDQTLKIKIKYTRKFMSLNDMYHKNVSNIIEVKSEYGYSIIIGLFSDLGCERERKIWSVFGKGGYQILPSQMPTIEYSDETHLAQERIDLIKGKIPMIGKECLQRLIQL